MEALSVNSDLIDYRNGIVAIDSGYVRPKLAAIHLIESQGRAAFVDTATYTALPRALAALMSKGLSPESVDWVILTHIHLDHAGGAGAMMETFPNAKLLVHPRGVRHMIEPSKLIAGVEAVYGRSLAHQMYGELRPIAPERIVEAHDGMTVRLGSRDLLCLDTPGHARHHIAILDRQTTGLFTGDTFGVSYREMDVDGKPLVFPSTTPVQFDPAAMRASITRLLTFQPEALYLTHYSRIEAPYALALDVLRRIDNYVTIAVDSRGATDPAANIRACLTALTLTDARAHGFVGTDEEILAIWNLDIDLNAQGLAIWAEAQPAEVLPA